MTTQLLVNPGRNYEYSWFYPHCHLTVGNDRDRISNEARCQPASSKCHNEGLLSFITRILTHVSYLSLDQCHRQDLFIPDDDTRFALDAFVERGFECHLQYHLRHLSTGYPICVHRTVCSSKVSFSRDPSVGVGLWCMEWYNLFACLLLQRWVSR